MHHGRHTQGDEVRLSLLCATGAGVPAAPDACPTLDIYGPSGPVLEGAHWHPAEPAAAPGLFAASVFLGGDFPAGEYAARATYSISSVQYQSLAYFSVAAGGDPSGRVRAMTYYDRPPASFVVQQRDSGRLYKGKNPRV